MTVNHDHALLFVTPSAPPAVQAIVAAAGRPAATVNSGAEAMVRLRNPFAVQPTPSAQDGRSTHPARRV
jgi:hypothetical protein